MLEVDPTFNPYLFGCLILLAFWALALVVARRRRDAGALREFWWSSFACALLGVTEPLFVPEYWSPPSILKLGNWDFESFPFCFAVGGIVAVLPEAPALRRLFERLTDAVSEAWNNFKGFVMGWLTGGRPASRPETPGPAARELTREEVVRDNLVLVAAFLGAFGATAHLGLNVIYDAALVCVAMAVLVAWWRPSLRWQILSGGFTFTLVYAVTLRVVGAVYPSFYVDHWNLGALSGRFILGAPAEEYLFALTLGLFWAPLYEAWKQVQNAR
jgi:hypothetical protein